MAAQRVHSAARSSHVAQQQLDHRRRANNLRSESVLRPAYRVNNRRHFLHVPVFAHGREHVDRLQILFLRDARDPLHGFRRVARILLLHQLENAARMLQRQVVGYVRRQ